MARRSKMRGPAIAPVVEGRCGRRLPPRAWTASSPGGMVGSRRSWSGRSPRGGTRRAALARTPTTPPRRTPRGPRAVEAGPDAGRGEVSRAGVAAVVAEVLDTPGTAGVTFELKGGATPIAAAVAALAQASPS